MRSWKFYSIGPLISHNPPNVRLRENLDCNVKTEQQNKRLSDHANSYSLDTQPWDCCLLLTRSPKNAVSSTSAVQVRTGMDSFTVRIVLSSCSFLWKWPPALGFDLLTGRRVPGKSPSEKERTRSVHLLKSRWQHPPVRYVCWLSHNVNTWDN